MKRILMLVLACCLIFNSTVMCAMASQDVGFSFDDINEIIADAAVRMSELTATDRANGFLLAQNYFKTDAGIDSLITIIEEEAFGTDAFVSNLQGIISDDEVFIMLLNLIKCIDEDDRSEVLEGFAVRNELQLSSSLTNDLYDIYEEFVDPAIIDALETENAITGEMIAELFTVFDGKIMFTDTKYGSSNFALKSMSSSFKSKINNVLKEYTFNDKKYSATSFVDAMLDYVNDTYTKSTKEKIKNIFEKVGIYEAAKKPTTTSTGSGFSTLGDDPTFMRPVASPVVAPTNVIAQIVASGNEVRPFDDAAAHWSNDYLNVMRHVNIIAGDAGTNNYRPDALINREEMAVIVARYMGLRDGVNYDSYEHIKFADSDDVSNWAASSISFLATKGIILGYPDGNYMPKQNITREEAVAIISRVIDNKYAVIYDTAAYVDNADIGDWAKEDVKYTSDLKIVSGYTDGAFLPKNYITRSELAVLIYNSFCVEGMIK